MFITYKKYIVAIIVLVTIIVPMTSYALPESSDPTVVRARVINIVTERNESVDDNLFLSDTRYQTLQLELLPKQDPANYITLEQDFGIFKPGDRLFLYEEHNTDTDTVTYRVRDLDRRLSLVLYVLLFMAVVIYFSGKQGIRSIMSLLGSFLVILYILIPSLIAGYNPIIISTVIAGMVLFFAIYLTHGFNRESTVAFLGTVSAVMVTGLLAWIGVISARLTGLASEEAFFLSMNTAGTLDFTGLLLGGIIIGVLGVLDDIAITQAAVVSELYQSAPHLSRREVYARALRVGKEHSGALVNTLALAYTGASLPLLLLFSTSSYSFGQIVNQEMFATEIIRTTVGSIGLILTVPITTLLAVYMLRGYTGDRAHNHIHTHHHHH